MLVFPPQGSWYLLLSPMFPALVIKVYLILRTLPGRWVIFSPSYGEEARIPKVKLFAQSHTAGRQRCCSVRRQGPRHPPRSTCFWRPAGGLAHDVPSHDADRDTESILHLHSTFQQCSSALNSGHELSQRRGVGPLPSSSPESPQPLPEGHEKSFAHWTGRSGRFPKQQLPGLPTASVPLPCTAATQCTGLGAKDLSPSSA